MNIIVNHIRKAGLLMAALLMTAALFAQDRIVVKGVVSDENGQPLIGAGVMEKGTTNGAVTDIDGNYTLEVSADGVLTFSYISYKSQDMNVNGKAVIFAGFSDQISGMGTVFILPIANRLLQIGFHQFLHHFGMGSFIIITLK